MNIRVKSEGEMFSLFLPTQVNASHFEKEKPGNAEGIFGTVMGDELSFFPSNRQKEKKEGGGRGGEAPSSFFLLAGSKVKARLMKSLGDRRTVNCEGNLH
jgi:hypothetical protein